MGKTTIEWCDFTLNPWRGCTKIASGCAHCYADTLSKRNPGTLGIWGPNGTRVVASEAMWREPVKWNETPLLACADCGQTSEGERIKGGDFTGRSWFFECQGCLGSKYKIIRPRVFCASLADVFEDWQGEVTTSAGSFIDRKTWRIPTNAEFRATLTDVRRRLFALIDATPNLDWLLLTKRPENIRSMWHGPYSLDAEGEPLSDAWIGRPNVWLGTSIATQADAERNIPHLLKCRDLSPVLFVSAEPLLGPVDLSQFLNCKCDVNGHCDLCLNGPSKRWVIVGGESGPHARPMHPDWVRALRDQCAAAGVPFLFKQHGEFLHESQWASCTVSLNAVFDNEHQFVKVGKKAAGRMLDGVIHDGYPTKLN